MADRTTAGSASGAAAASAQLQELRATRADAEQELREIRELLQRRDVDDAETRLRLETAIERLRAEYDVEPAVALDAPAPEVPGGTTLAGRAASSTASCGSWARSTHSRSRSTTPCSNATSSSRPSSTT